MPKDLETEESGDWVSYLNATSQARKRDKMRNTLDALEIGHAGSARPGVRRVQNCYPGQPALDVWDTPRAKYLCSGWERREGTTSAGLPFAQTAVPGCRFWQEATDRDPAIPPTHQGR